MSECTVAAIAGGNCITVTNGDGVTLRLNRRDAADLAADLAALTGPVTTRDPSVLDCLGPDSVIRTSDGCTWLAWATPQKRRAWWCDGAVESSVGLTDHGPVAVLWADPAGTP